MKLCDAISLYDLERMRKDWRGVPSTDDLQYRLAESIMDMNVIEFELYLIAIQLNEINLSMPPIREFFEER